MPTITNYDAARVAGIIACIYFAFCLLADFHSWVVTTLAYGAVPFRQAGRMLRFVAGSRIHYYLWGPIVPFLLMLGFYCVRGLLFPVAFIVSLLLFWLHIVLYQSTPPSVLLLGTSKSECVRIRHKLERGLYPYRVVVLFDPHAASASDFSRFARNLFEWDNLRTASGSWRSVVHPLMEMVPIIVMDTRFPTPGVIEEAKRVTTEGLSGKTVFLVGDKGNAPALGDSARPDMWGLRLSIESQLVPLLRTMGLSRTTSPDDISIFSGDRK